MEAARAAVLRFFRASPDEYDVVFTANASGALKLVGEAYPFECGSTLLLSYDNHNSVNGIREFARRREAVVTYVPVSNPDLRLDADLMLQALDYPAGSGRRLFAYPAQSNFSGVQHPLEWVEQARERGWDVLLDSAAFVPTNRLDLSVGQTRLRLRVLLQDVRLPHGGGRPHRPPRGAGHTAAALVRGGHHHAGVSAG